MTQIEGEEECPLPEKTTKDVRGWFKGKTIQKVLVTRPVGDELAMYEEPLGPMSLRFIFTDGTSATIDSYVGNFLLKGRSFSGLENWRQRSYFTVRRRTRCAKGVTKT